MAPTAAHTQKERFVERARAGLRSLYVGDSLAMPVHWYYNPMDILEAFPGGIQKFEDAPENHPSSIMSLHSTAKGGRGKQACAGGREIVGEVILKGKRAAWGLPNQHYHQGMKAGENTLNAHCARLVTRAMIAGGGRYNKERFLKDYIHFMTADIPRHPDTYAESYHRGFFANLESGSSPEQCGAVTHDTPSVGGLVMLAPIAIGSFVHGNSLQSVQGICRDHLFLTHPDTFLAKVSDAFVKLVSDLLFRENDVEARQHIAAAAQHSIGINVSSLAAKTRTDNEVVGRRYSTACYITDSWPSILYLAYKYVNDPKAGLLANTNLGGDNVHRGAILGVILGLATSRTVDAFFNSLTDRQAIDQEIVALLGSLQQNGK
ncbi:ADP-ribosylglycohydrolase family protein [Desulfogranum marinum]|uniref:ADP-ribosylglycohydrolase family protein n=1 Tax=Desulfogranum marinum TaxID=453220 RepID=UPI0029C68575|nr:ADP-ribosylglycohydrolase family protein [Desulfogranum marinum]